MKRISLLLMLFVIALSGCHTLDDDRIPPLSVNIVFSTVADWNVYGVSAAMDYKRFIRDERIPSNYPYTASTYTGYGGVLLVMDIMGEPRAYDLACPVEVKQSVRLTIDKETHYAVCPECKSEFDVFSLYGYPVSGTAASKGYGLRRYNVAPKGTTYMVIGY